MTLVSEPPVRLAATPVPPATPAAPYAPVPAGRPPELPARPLTGRRLAVLATCWTAVLLVALALAATAVGGLRETRAQHASLVALRQQFAYAEAASRSVLSAGDVAPVPAAGAPVALLQVPRLGLQRVVREGAAPGQTQEGPGHVPGTAAPGQPGNAVVVGRHAAYGAAFGRIGELRRGDPLLVTTVQGRSLYRVTGVRRTSDDVLAPSGDDRLTLVTTAGRGPTGWSRSLVVTAVLVGKPFPPTAQGVRTPLTDGRHGDGSAWALVVIWTTLLVAGAAAAVLLYRRWLVRSTYLLTTPALVALVVLLADALTRLLPASV